eukprot:TRINITY_DN1539_c0_g2_i1.p1 TRINITY_DN1539_c0_g2~~TRINITY_DN1539_c0_g2_i1.p1  ORF type:complete len:140 (-),score=17.56 TRINITY_DN1539_c0_g2_i1:40-459(-)
MTSFPDEEVSTELQRVSIACMKLSHEFANLGAIVTSDVQRQQARSLAYLEDASEHIRAAATQAAENSQVALESLVKLQDGFATLAKELISHVSKLENSCQNLPMQVAVQSVLFTLTFNHYNVKTKNCKGQDYVGCTAFT